MAIDFISLFLRFFKRKNNKHPAQLKPIAEHFISAKPTQQNIASTILNHNKKHLSNIDLLIQLEEYDKILYLASIGFKLEKKHIYKLISNKKFSIIDTIKKYNNIYKPFYSELTDDLIKFLDFEFKIYLGTTFFSSHISFKGEHKIDYNIESNYFDLLYIYSELNELLNLNFYPKQLDDHELISETSKFKNFNNSIIESFKKATSYNIKELLNNKYVESGIKNEVILKSTVYEAFYTLWHLKEKQFYDIKNKHSNDIIQQISNDSNVFQNIFNVNTHNTNIEQAYQSINESFQKLNLIKDSLDDWSRYQKIFFEQVPLIISKFQAIPIDYRNSMYDKNGSTPADLCIQSLNDIQQLFDTKINQLESIKAENNFTDLKVSNNYINQLKDDLLG